MLHNQNLVNFFEGYMARAEIRITQITSAEAARVVLVQQSHAVCKLYSLLFALLLKVASSI